MNLVLDIVVRLPLDAETERDIFCHVHIREQRILLEHRIDLPLLGRQLRDVRAIKQDAAAVRQLEAPDQPQRRRLPAPRRPEKRHELIFMNGEVEILDDLPPVIRFVDALQAQQFFFHLSLSLVDALPHSSTHLGTSFSPALRRQILGVALLRLAVCLLDQTKNLHQSGRTHRGRASTD